MRIDRNSFGTSSVFALIKSNSLDLKEALRLLEEAIHVIILLRQQKDTILETIAIIQKEIDEYK